MAATITLSTESLEKTNLPIAVGFAKKAQELYTRPLTLTTANLAAEADADAKRFIENCEAKRTELKKPILEAGRKLDEFWKTIRHPAEEARLVYRTIVSRYEIQERQRVEELRRIEEAKALAEAENQRRIEAEALAAAAAATNDESLMQAALEKEAEPLTTIAITTPEPVKVAGMTVRMKKVGTVNQPRELLKYLLDGQRDDLINELITWSQSGIDAALARGLSLPGVQVQEKPITTNRMR